MAHARAGSDAPPILSQHLLLSVAEQLKLPLLQISRQAELGKLVDPTAAIVWAPTALWLVLSGDVGRGIVLILVGVFGIGLADNILRPLLLSGRTTASGLVVFLGLLGGAAAFGFIGLVLGPIVLVTAGSLLRVFSAEGRIVRTEAPKA